MDIFFLTLSQFQPGEHCKSPCFQAWKQEQQQADICLGNVSKGGEVLTQLISRTTYLLPLVRNTQSLMSPVDPQAMATSC